jgi:hypothetical protein
MHAVQSKKNTTVASAMTDVANHATRAFIAITIMTATSGAASKPLTTALQ